MNLHLIILIVIFSNILLPNVEEYINDIQKLINTSQYNKA
ncbi:uncharacterized protein METZ01_LOCUS412360, partial [marine metagenome]